MAQIEESLLAQSKENPDQEFPVVVTVDERFDVSGAAGLGLKELDIGLLYAGSLSGRNIRALGERDGVLAIEPDLKVSITQP